MSHWPDPPALGPDLDDEYLEWCEEHGHDPDDDDTAAEWETVLIETALDRRADDRLDDWGCRED